MTYDQTRASAAPPTRGKGTLITGLVLLAIGAVAIITGIILAGNAVSSVLDSSRISSAQTAPATLTTQLDGGTTYAIYEVTPAGATVQAGDIVVTGPSGR